MNETFEVSLETYLFTKPILIKLFYLPFFNNKI